MHLTIVHDAFLTAEPRHFNSKKMESLSCLCCMITVNINSYQFQNIALCKSKRMDRSTILTDKWPNFSCTAILQHWTSTMCFPTKHNVSMNNKDLCI